MQTCSDKTPANVFLLVAWHPINEVTLCRAGLVIWWVTACGQVNHVGT